MRLNQTSKLKVMTIWISQQLPLFNFERLDILCAWIRPPSVKLWPFELLKSFHCSILSISIYYAPESDLRVISYDHLNFSRASVVQFRASGYLMRLNLTSVLKVMTISISRESFHFSISSIWICYAPESDLRVKSYDHLNFSRASIVQFLASRYIMRLNLTSVWKVMTIWISRESFHFSISSIWICYAPESGIRDKSYDHLNFSRASLVQFRASLYVMRLNRTSELKVLTIWICREVPLFNFERLDILCA